MSLRKELREKSSVSYIDLFTFLFPDAKTKYYDMFINIIKNRVDSFDDESKNDVYEHLSHKIKGDKEKMDVLKKMPIENVYALKVLSNLIEMEMSLDLEVLEEFISLNERNLIEKNDLTTYKNYDDLVQQVSLASLRASDKEMEKQVYKVHEDEDWLILRPLTTQSSVKYGFGAKWCTAMSNDSSYFSNYSYEGILIYTINKKTGYKAACYKNRHNVNLTFWDMMDNQMDSLQIDLPHHILLLIKKEVYENEKTNFQMLKECLGDESAIKELEHELKASQPQPEDIYYPIRARVEITEE